MKSRCSHPHQPKDADIGLTRRCHRRRIGTDAVVVLDPVQSRRSGQRSPSGTVGHRWTSRSLQSRYDDKSNTGPNGYSGGSPLQVIIEAGRWEPSYFVGEQFHRRFPARPGAPAHLDNNGSTSLYIQKPDDDFRGRRSPPPTSIIDAQDGPVVLVGHSYGRTVITEAGSHPHVLAWFTSRVRPGRASRSPRCSRSRRGATAPPILPAQDGFLLLDNRSSTPPSPPT